MNMIHSDHGAQLTSCVSKVFHDEPSPMATVYAFASAVRAASKVIVAWVGEKRPHVIPVIQWLEHVSPINVWLSPINGCIVG